MEKEKDLVEIVEFYNKDGVCIKRTANGVDLPADTEPSVVFSMPNVSWVKRKSQMTKEEFNKVDY